MNKKVFVYDPTTKDKQSAVRGVGRYLQILKENFPEWTFSSFPPNPYPLTPNSLFINPFFNFLQPPLTLKRIAQKQIAVIHDLIPLKYPSHFPAGIRGNINIALNKYVLRNYDLIITDSEASKKDIIDKLQVASYKIKVIYPCLTKSFNRSNVPTFKRSNVQTEVCLYVGDATWNKNLVALARAIKIANVNCIFVGKVFENLTVDDRRLKVGVEDRKSKIEKNPTSILYHQYLSSIINHLSSNKSHPWKAELNEFNEITKNDKRFIFPGFVPDSELIKFYEQASFNILPSRDEGFGFSFLESAQFGCPSLLSDIPILREISEGKAIFFDQNNPTDIAEKIKEIINDKNLRNKIGDGAKKRSEFFSRKKFRKEFLSIIQKT